MFPVGLPRVGIGSVLNDDTVVVLEVRVSHAQGVEDALLRKLGQRLARHLLYHHREQSVAAVAIEKSIAGREVQLGLLKQQAGDILVGDLVLKPPSCEEQEIRLVPYAARVMKQLADRDHL